MLMNERHISGRSGWEFSLDKFEEYTLGDFRREMEAGRLRSAQLVDYYLQRIEAIDRQGPALNSLLYLNLDAPSIAAERDREWRAGIVRGPLHGIPVVLKANINTADSMPTTAGSQALHGFLAPEDAPIVARLREAGAVILGKANLSEWANFRSKHSSSGWSSEGLQTKNPYVLERNPSGSSSGSAVAVSANLCALAVGTETDGSIISPASINGIAGIKPTGGLLSAEGIIPISFTQDTAGSMARTLEDAIVLLAAMSGRDYSGVLRENEALLERLDPAGGLLYQSGSGGSEGRRRRPLEGIRLGYAEKLSRFLPQVEDIMKKTIAVLEKLGAEIVVIDIEPDEEVQKAEYQVLLYEFKYGIDQYLARYVAGRELEALDSIRMIPDSKKTGGVQGAGSASNPWPRTLRDIIAFNAGHADVVMPYFGQEILLEAAEKGSLEEPEYKNALALCRAFEKEKGISAYIAKYRLDAIVAASNSPAWKTDHLLGDHYVGGNTSLAAIAAAPHITVPAGFVDELPIGLSVFGVPYSEEVLFRIGLAFERATKVRKAPWYKGA